MTLKKLLPQKVRAAGIIGNRSIISIRFWRREITGSFGEAEGSPITPQLILFNAVTGTAVKRGSLTIFTNLYGRPASR